MLFVTILICSISTTIPITDYFSRSKTWEYLGKIKLWGNDRLPGVFDNNAYAHTVNGSLWSLKWEWLMYCILAAIGFLPRRWWTPVIFISAFLSIAITKITTSPFIVNTVPLLQHISSSQNPFPLASFFLVGAFISIRKFRTHCKINSPFVWFISGITGILLAVHQPVIALSLLVPIIIVIVGESSFSATMGFEIKHDLSYGLYIYAFPIQQSIVAFWPHTSWWEIFLLATPITTVMAFLSWHYVEKPALQLKAHLRSLPYKKLI